MPPKPPRQILKPSIPSKTTLRAPPKLKPKLNAVPSTQPSSSPFPHTPSAPPPPTPTSRPRSPLPPWLRSLGRTGSIIFFSGATFLFIRDNVVSIDTVRGSSMAPTLSPGAHERGQNDWVLIRRDVTGIAHVQRGDIVTFWKPHRPSEVSIKRIVGLPGDTVYPHRGYSLDEDLVRGEKLGVNDGLEGEVGKVVVPFGHVWVEGDNWRRSYDSCDFGPVSKSLIDGKAVRVWRRGWWRGIVDGRDGKGKTRVVEGRSEMPALFLE